MIFSRVWVAFYLIVILAYSSASFFVLEQTFLPCCECERCLYAVKDFLNHLVGLLLFCFDEYFTQEKANS